MTWDWWEKIVYLTILYTEEGCFRLESRGGGLGILRSQRHAQVVDSSSFTPWLPSSYSTFVNQNGPSVSRALATAPANEHSASRSRLLRFLCNGFLLADYRITRRSLWAKFTFVTFMTSLTFRTCSTISGSPCLPGIPFLPGIPCRPSVPSLPTRLFLAFQPSHHDPVFHFYPAYHSFLVTLGHRMLPGQ